MGVDEPDLAQHLLDRLRLGTDLADQLLHVRGQQRRVQRILGEQRADELLVVLRQPIRLLVAEPGELPPQRLPEQAGAVLFQRRHQLGQHLVAKRGAVARDVEEAHRHQQPADPLGVAAELGQHHQPADLRQSLVVVADAQHAVDEVTIERLAVALLLQHVEVDVGRLAAAVLGEDHRRSHHPPAVALDRHEHVAAIVGGRRHGPRRGGRERPLRSLDDLRQRVAIVRQVHRIEVSRRALKVVDVLGGDVADDEAGHRFTLSHCAAGRAGG
jgi:hypothetical protein